MKLVLLTAAALLATPVLAQQNTPTNPPANTGSPPVPGDTKTPPTTDSMTPPAGQNSMSSPTDSGTASTAAPAGDPAGGYQPSNMGSAPPAGANVTYQQAQTPDQAYPAPAPMAHYPICKPGQYDDCMQASAAHRTTHRMVRRRK